MYKIKSDDQNNEIPPSKYLGMPPTMTHMVTRCPKCGTAFRITTTQLESAKGQVRCGSCLHIFKAHDDLISDTPAAIAEQTPAAETLSTDPIDNQDSSLNLNIDLDNDTLISDDMDKSSTENNSYEFEGYMDIDLNPTQTISLFERPVNIKPDTEEESVDESWAEELLGDDKDILKALEDDKTPPEPTITTSGKPSIVNAIMERHSVEVPDASEYARINQEFSNLYKTPLFSIVNDDEQEQKKEEKNQLSDNHFISARIDDKESLHDSEIPQDSFGKGFFRNHDEEQSSQTHKHPLKSQPAIHATQDSRAALLMNIAPSPIEITAQRIRSLSQKFLWPSLAIIAAITLIAQIAYFKFNQLSRLEPYRTAYVWLCPLFHCQVPGLVDTSKIIAYQLILRNHPEVANALLMDVMIRNDAEFEQPFPDIILAFTTMDEKPVASRRFTPKEYLGGELAGIQRIPPKQPVHITLELSDPGPDAVNYHMSIAH